MNNQAGSVGSTPTVGSNVLMETCPVTKFRERGLVCGLPIQKGDTLCNWHRGAQDSLLSVHVDEPMLGWPEPDVCSATTRKGDKCRYSTYPGWVYCKIHLNVACRRAEVTLARRKDP